MFPLGQHDHSQLHHKQRDHVEWITRCGIEYIDGPNIDVAHVFATASWKFLFRLAQKLIY